MAHHYYNLAETGSVYSLLDSLRIPRLTSDGLSFFLIVFWAFGVLSLSFSVSFSRSLFHCRFRNLTGAGGVYFGSLREDFVIGFLASLPAFSAAMMVYTD